jgi:hypothetical protein
MKSDIPGFSYRKLPLTATAPLSSILQRAIILSEGCLSDLLLLHGWHDVPP